MDWNIQFFKSRNDHKFGKNDTHARFGTHCVFRNTVSWILYCEKSSIPSITTILCPSQYFFKTSPSVPPITNKKLRQQLRNLFFELFYVFKFSIHTRKTNIRNMIEFFRELITDSPISELCTSCCPAQFSESSLTISRI